MRPAELPETWRALAAELRDLAAEGQARALERCAGELEAALADSAGELLSLEAAAVESGYSVRQLRHLLGTKQVPNAGRKHAPRIRRADLPLRPKGVPAAGQGSAFDPDAFALALHARAKRSA